MTLLRRCMGWDIGSAKWSKQPELPTVQPALQRYSLSPQFRALHRRLLLSYIGSIAAIVGISTIAVYQFVVYSLYHELDEQLRTLANAATHSLPEIEQDPTKVNRPVPQTVDADGDLDLPWQNLRTEDQVVEWFDRDRRRLISAGQTSLGQQLLPEKEGVQTLEDGKIRALTVPAQFKRTNKIQGYVRVSAPTTEITEDLNRLLSGLAVGGGMAVILSGIAGDWLTRRSVQPIEQSMQRLHQFTADASHELRNTLTAIKTAVAVMESHPERVHPADVEKIGAIASATDQMTQLVEDLLLLARADAKTASTRLTNRLIPLDELLEDLIEDLRPQVELKGLTLQSPDFQPSYVQGDAAQLRRLFANLLENALYYTPPGGTIQIASYRQEEMLTIAITDTGIGIAPEQIPYVFDRFWRADQARSYRDAGSGLGLAIAQAIAQLHRGDITVTSHLGVGSRFQVRLPEIIKY